MKTKTTFLALLALGIFLVVAVPALAQGKPLVSPTIQDGIASLRTQIQADRQKVVADNLGLTEAEGKAFWPLYREYRAELDKVGDRTVKLLTGYAANIDTMTDEKASGMIKESLSIQKDEIAVREKWVKKFEKVIPAKKLARFYQIENKMDVVIKLALAAEVPLVE
jgi:hypothetical protein